MSSCLNEGNIYPLSDVPRTCVLSVEDEEETSKDTEILLDIILLVEDVTGLVVLDSWLVRDGTETTVEADSIDKLLPNDEIFEGPGL